MILKEFNYNEYNFRLHDGGEILIREKDYSSDYLIISLADVPIINELTKNLLKYYVEWKKCQPLC